MHLICFIMVKRKWSKECWYIFIDNKYLCDMLKSNKNPIWLIIIKCSLIYSVINCSLILVCEYVTDLLIFANNEVISAFFVVLGLYLNL